MESSRLAFWTGVDSAVSHDGSGSLAGLEMWWLGGTTTSADVFPGSVVVERPVVTVVLWTSHARSRIRGNPRSAGNDHRDLERFSIGGQVGRDTLVAVHCVGFVCIRPQCHFVADERVDTIPRV